MLNKAFKTIQEEKFKVCVCGSMSHLLNLPQNAIVSDQTAIILKQMAMGYRKDISIPFIQLDLDYEHSASKEDFEII